jgi:hypothetical protein
MSKQNFPPVLELDRHPDMVRENAKLAALQADLDRTLAEADAATAAAAPGPHWDSDAYLAPAEFSAKLTTAAARATSAKQRADILTRQVEIQKKALARTENAAIDELIARGNAESEHLMGIALGKLDEALAAVLAVNDLATRRALALRNRHEQLSTAIRFSADVPMILARVLKYQPFACEQRGLHVKAAS